MATEVFKNFIFKDSEWISDSKLKSKLLLNQIIKPFYCVLINFSLNNSYRIKIRNECMTSAIVFIKGQLISKGLFDVIVSTKKPTKFVLGFLS